MSATRYTPTAIALHWLMAVLLVGLFGVGLYMHDLPLSPWKLRVYSWHKWAGVTAFALVLARLAWRLGHRPPALPAAMPLVTHSPARAKARANRAALAQPPAVAALLPTTATEGRHSRPGSPATNSIAGGEAIRRSSGG